jgi:hypothetical protein
MDLQVFHPYRKVDDGYFVFNPWFPLIACEISMSLLVCPYLYVHPGTALTDRYGVGALFVVDLGPVEPELVEPGINITRVANGLPTC